MNDVPSFCGYLRQFSWEGASVRSRKLVCRWEWLIPHAEKVPVENKRDVLYTPIQTNDLKVNTAHYFKTTSKHSCFICGQFHHPCLTFKSIILGEASDCRGWMNATLTISQLWQNCGKVFTSQFLPRYGARYWHLGGNQVTSTHSKRQLHHNRSGNIISFIAET